MYITIMTAWGSTQPKQLSKYVSDQQLIQRHKTKLVASVEVALERIPHFSAITRDGITVNSVSNYFDTFTSSNPINLRGVDRILSNIYDGAFLQKHIPYLSAFSPNSAKYGPKNSEYEHFSHSLNLQNTLHRKLQQFLKNINTKVEGLQFINYFQPAIQQFTRSKLTIETLGKGVKYVQSKQ